MADTDVFNLQRMQTAATKAQALLKALSNTDRLMLLCHLAEGERNVSDLENTLGITQPTLSQQLGVLRREGMVTTRRDGKLIFYSIASTEALTLIKTLYQLFCTPESTE